MSFDDDDDSIDSAFAYPCDDDTPSAGFDAYPQSPHHVPPAAAPADSSFAVRPGNWRRKLKQEATESKVRVNGKEMGSDITFDMPHNAPDIVLALVTMNIRMLFGSSLQSRLRGLWDDTHFMVEFYIVADAESPLGISIASNSTAEFHTAPKTFKDAGSRSVSHCFQEGAMSAIVLRALQSGFKAWHTTFFHTAERCRHAQAAPHQEALQILKDALERPCCVSATDASTGVISTCGDDFLSICDNELNDGSMDYHVRITVHNGCIAAIDFDGNANPRHQRFLHAARLRLGLRQAPLPISTSTAAAIVELIMAPLVHRDADATPNLFSYLAAHVALSMKNCLASVNSHTGAELARPSVMPFVPLSDLSLYAIDNGMCGLALQDALCSIPPDVLTIVFKSAVAATDKSLHKSGSSATFDLCQPWPSFLLKQIVRNEDRSGIVGDAARRADTDSKGFKSGADVAAKSQAALHAGLGIENKKVEEWRNSLLSALHALQHPALIDTLLAARQGSPVLEQRETILQMFLSLSAAHSGQETSMIAKICGYVLRTLPYLPVPVFDNVLWFGNGTPWEDGLADDCLILKHNLTTFYYHGTNGFAVYSIMRNNLISFSGTELMGVGQAHGPGLYFSDAQSTASGYAHPSGEFASSPIFFLEAPGGDRFWEKTSTICTSLYPAQYHATVRRSRPSPHANVVIRGLFNIPVRGIFKDLNPPPSSSYQDRSYFQRAQAAYAEAVGMSDWGQVDPGALAIVAPSPSQGLKCSAVQP